MKMSFWTVFVQYCRRLMNEIRAHGSLMRFLSGVHKAVHLSVLSFGTFVFLVNVFLSLLSCVVSLSSPVPTS